MVASFEIQYETAASVPAPYAHFYHVKASFGDDHLRMDYQLRYLDRDALTEEEITGEGFTLADDFSWHGTLPAVWATEIRRSIEQTNLRAEPANEADAYFKLVFKDEAGNESEGEPTDRAPWEYTAQELVQAVYETAQRERPLHVRYKKVNATGTSHRLSLTLRFSVRRVEVALEWSASGAPPARTQPGEPVRREVDWHQLKDLLRLVYLPDYHPENARSKEPRGPGTFLDHGDGFWYEFGVSVKNPGQKRDVLGEIERIMEGLVV
ncbi:MAG: hypothetical protein H7Z75_11835 [Ferruginibacter sp.]|nr:hypothetical protein [Cytophagales bacterium]